MTRSSGYVITTLLGLAAFALGSLIAGAPYLETPLPGGLPFGNALAALGLCATAGAAFTLARGRVRAAALLALVAAAAWLPGSVALAGNLALVFSGARGEVWMTWSGATLAFVLLALALAVLQRVVAVATRRSARAKGAAH